MSKRKEEPRHDRSIEETSSDKRKPSSLSVVIPTYNERENIIPFVESCISVLDSYNFEIIIVDDDSPDNTWEVARQFASNVDIVRVIRRQGSTDLATAISRGFRESTKDACVVIDADFQHPPERIPDLFEALREGSDVAIGSRYLGEADIQHWSRSRKLISRGAILLSWVFVPTTRHFTDPVSGFFAIRNSKLEEIAFKMKGYKILLEILGNSAAPQIVEIPYVFTKRKQGDSNLSSMEYVNFLRQILALELSESRREGRDRSSVVDSIATHIGRVERMLLAGFRPTHRGKNEE